ncbi:putative dolichyl-diphosphooligosaccharide--protein glycosyltransferase 48 kDa subunit precursor [Kockovaella imperatae]|uniref:Dolichyl-diphosphooligosaccharide--protein glycosyltransferase subunit WBP1 n=1 Tax=Kockovaella imperatae TaxID=4999 RepID=A0A1Y1UCT7_9TREE|nr:putative dolichyl-diphosphooligosaccharide--protein glycosyltransferase 48 kDa subunit precursor [Kockovaella imperatae]ORX35326.1 putative dolichyl-diphosphooligosaccharide--protein glycosyltransferase 48 kDa subunit precursor [Kockovaella imperatae]
MYGPKWSSLSALFTLVSSLSSVNARSATGDRVLVVLEPKVVKEDYSKFWSSLEKRGFELTFKGPKDESAVLQRYGEALYDHLIMFTPSVKSYANGLSPKEVISAQFAGLNTLYLLSSNISEINRDTFREYDLEFAERDYTYLDAFSHSPGSSLAAPLLYPQSSLIKSGAVLSASTLTGGPIVFPGSTSFTLGQNPFLVEVAHGSKTGYVGENRLVDADEAEVEAGLGKRDAASTTGKKAGLVAAMQTRDNVRIGFVASGSMFSDEWWGTEVELSSPKNVAVPSGNAAFAEDLTKWIFQETGVVKVISTTHHRKGELEQRESYRIKDDLTFSISLAEHVTLPDGTSSWQGFETPDLQLEFTMLDPHIRTSLSVDPARSDSKQTTYSKTFKAPDRHGVFKFVVEYWRSGYSYISTSDTASVVPFRHDEYPRFILGAWPFYSSAISMSAAFLLFCGLWVAVGEGDRKGKKKAE